MNIQKFLPRLFLLIFVSGIISSTTTQNDALKYLTVHQAMIPDTILELDDCEGRLEMNAVGDRGSNLSLVCSFKGVYVVPSMGLTSAIEEGVDYQTMGGDWKDVYHIVPKSITFIGRISSRSEEKCSAGYTDSSVRRETVSSYSHTFTTPPPPGEGATPLAVQQWLQSTGSFEDPVKCSYRIFVTSKQPEGGRAFADVLFSLEEFSGMLSTSSVSVTTPPVVPEVDTDTFADWEEVKCALSFNASQVRRHMEDVHNFNSGFPLQRAWIETSELEVPNEFSLENFWFRSSGSSPTRWQMHPLKTDNCVILSDQSYSLSYDFFLGTKMDVDAVLKPAEDNEESEENWKPEPHSKRKYTLKINDPSFEEVQAIKFRLEEVSAYPGIATNAGNHLVRKGKCEDCGERIVEYYTHKTQFHSDSQLNQKTLRRRYSFYNQCKLDSLPDMFFTERDNPGYKLGEGANTEDLLYPLGQEIVLEEGIKEGNSIVLYIADGAASGKLSAAVNIGGVWYDAAAEGPTAIAVDASVLEIPLDSNRNGLQDSWEEAYGVTSSGEDGDNLPNATYLGDGLTNFEEYRGVCMYYELGFNRLDPTRKDLFAHDYTGDFLLGMVGARSIYEDAGVDFHFLKDNEFYADVINFQETENRGGDQYIVVLMTDDLMVGDFSWLEGFIEGRGLATHIGPPLKNANTVVISGNFNYTNPGALIAHEIGHNVNISHHGEAEKSIIIQGETGWVACIHGQHSGCFDCIMKYANARWFLEAETVPDSLTVLQESFSLKDYPAEKGAKNAICTSPAGTGINSDGWGREASSGRGDCLGQINIKSWN